MSKGRRLVDGVMAAGLVAVLLAGCASNGGGDGGSTDSAGPKLSENPDLAQLDFPSLDEFGYEDGTDALCAAFDQVMAARGYRFMTGAAVDDGIKCSFGTPTMSTVEDGSHQLLADVYAARSGATRYRDILAATAEYRDGTLDDPSHSWGELEAFPVGEEGFITHFSLSERSGEVRSAFRSGKDTYGITVTGAVVHRGERSRKPMSQKDGYREVTGIVQALNGDTDAEEPLISQTATQEYAGMPELGSPVPPAEGTEEERCAALESAAAPLELKLDRVSKRSKSTYHCEFEPVALTGGKAAPYLSIDVADYSDEEVLHAAEALGKDLGLVMESFSENATAGQLYLLPAGDSGYLIYHEVGEPSPRGQLSAAYTVGEVYVKIGIHGSRYTGSGDELGDKVVLTEAELVEILTKFLSGIGR